MGDEQRYEWATALASFVVAFGMAVPGMIGTEVRRAAVGFIGIRMPRMTAPTVPTLSAAVTAFGTGVTAFDRYVGNSTMAKSITDRLFPPVNLTRDQEQAQEKVKQEIIKDIAYSCEQFWPGSGKWVSYAINAVWGFFGLVVTKATEWFWKKMGERVAVAETAVDPTLKKNARKKSPGPARKSTRTRK